MATIRDGPAGMAARRPGLGFMVGTVMIIFGGPDEAAALIFWASSLAIWSRRPRAASRGLVTKSKGPKAKVRNVMEALASVCALTTMTGTRCRHIIWLSIENQLALAVTIFRAPALISV